MGLLFNETKLGCQIIKCKAIASLAPPAPLKEKGSGESLYIEVRNQECNYVT